MSDFVAINPKKPDEGEILNNPFFPNIKLSEVREAQNIDNTVTTDRLQRLIITAASRVNEELREYRLEMSAQGYQTLNEVPGEAINEVKVACHHYLYAVYATTHALLIERYRNFDATAEGIKKSESVIQTADDLYREARYAIRDILQVSHSTFELI